MKKLAKDTTTTVYTHNHKNFDSMLRKFKKRIQNSGIIDEYKENQVFIKPSTKKRLKIKKARYNARTSN